MNKLAGLHDVSSRGLFLAAGAALSLVVALYLFEVCARYFFDAPTTWSGELVQYCLSAIVFLSLPEITRRNAHIAIDLVPTTLTGRKAEVLARLNATLGGLACATAGVIVSIEVHKQFVRGLLTNSVHPIPRWWITTIIALGLLSAALHFLRQACARPEARV